MDTSQIVINLNDVFELKKGHPCGTNRWQVIRTGADIKIKCLGCGHIVMIDRVTFKRSIKNKLN